MKLNIQFYSIIGTIFSCLVTSTSSSAQIIPDQSLPNNSQINGEGNPSIINGGTQAGTNLFHSFEQFSLPTGGSLHFNNTLDIENIFTRVTGNSISNIDGSIGANGTANLFLLNPNGIVFGSHAKLNIGGSFLGTTATSVNFADGFQFTTVAPASTPLLTVNVPVGLGFGSNSGAIRGLGSGHNLILGNNAPINRNNSSQIGLQVQTGRTLALVGGDISLEGIVLTAFGGRIELGSVERGQVRLNSSSSGWNLDYTGATSFKNINLSQKSLADASGSGSGSIQLQGKNLHLDDASFLLLQNQGTFPAGAIRVSASESVEIKGFDPSRKIVSGIWSETLDSGNGAEISVSTPELKLQSSGQIFSATLSSADAGNINLSVPKTLQIIGARPGEVGGGVVVTSVSVGSGKSGDITISTGKLDLANGGVILTSSLLPLADDKILEGSGNITINATNSVEVNGTASDNLFNASSISAATFSNALLAM